jgi:hypothetical protein
MEDKKLSMLKRIKKLHGMSSTDLLHHDTLGPERGGPLQQSTYQRGEIGDYETVCFAKSRRHIIMFS